MTEKPAPVQPGDVLAGKYEVERVLGQGGMSVVVAAKHLQLHQRVALKFLHAESTHRPEAVERFLREGRAVVRIQSEHTARVSDFGCLDDGSPYLVMEYLEGADLAQVLRSRGPLPVPDAVDYLLQACEAIAEAHLLGIVHRDLKPSNLFVTRRADGTPFVKVLDFGISKVVVDGAPESSDLTGTHATFGSPRYVSPEQARSSRDVDARSDVWALGVVLYELTTGTPAFDGPTASSVIAQIVSDEPAPLRGYLPDAPKELVSVIELCLRKDRTQRPRSVGEFVRALAPLAPETARGSMDRIRRLSVASDETASMSLPLASCATEADTTPSVDESKSRRSRRLAALVAICVIGVGAGMVGAYFLAANDEAVTPNNSAAVSAVSEPAPGLSASSMPAASEPEPRASAAVEPSATGEPQASPPLRRPAPAPRPAPPSRPAFTAPTPVRDDPLFGRK